MFTDLVDSTGLADSMDPEDFRTLIEAHRTIAVAPILRYGGVVTRYLGDGMLVLFGYPEAHEDDAERSVRAGLDVAEATVEMNRRWVGEGSGRIAVRIGVHTGIVIVGDVLKEDVQEMMAVFGNVPSIAARLQVLAKPNGVVLSGATKELLPPAIQCETRGNTMLKGLSSPLEIFTAIDIRDGQGDRRVAGRLLPFVNREKEMATIRRCWAMARKGRGRCLTIAGDPGIGKSRLVRAVEERIVTQPSRWLITRTSPYASNTDFFAFSELFRQLLPIDTFDHLRKALASQGFVDPDRVIGLASLFGIPAPKDATTTALRPERAREMTLGAIVAWLQHEAGRQPLVLIIEDLHWADASSLEAIDRLKAGLADHPILLIITTRSAAKGRALTMVDEGGSPSGDATPAAAANVMMTEGDDAIIYLDRLRSAHAEDLLGHVLRGAALPKSAVATLLQRANGVPLYLEELPKPVIESDGGAAGGSIALPATLRDSLMAQLDRLGQAKIVAQTAAVLGHSFERSLLEHVWNRDPKILESGLTILADAGLIIPGDDANTRTYGFRHALLAEIAYDSLLRDDRRRIHRRTADILSDHFRPLAEARPELLARHHEAAGSHEEAFECWLMAGKAAARRSANKEAIEHFKDAEAALETADIDNIADSGQSRLALHLARGPVLISVLGWAAPEVEATYRQALDISRQIDLDYREEFRIWGGLSNVYLLRGDLRNARKTIERGHKIALEADDSERFLFSHRSLGLCSVLAAQYDNALMHMTAVESLISNDPVQQRRQTEIYGTNPCVIAFSIKAWCHWFKGDAREALKWHAKAIGVAQSAKHPFSLCYALCLGASLAQFRRDAEHALKLAERALEISADHAFPYWNGWAKIVKGWALEHLGPAGAGLPDLENGLAEYRSTGAAQMWGYGLCLLASAYQHAGQWCKAADTAEAAVAEIKKTGIVFYQKEALQVLGEARSSLTHLNPDRSN